MRSPRYLLLGKSKTIEHQNSMKRFLSCDWGTSSLRLRLVNTVSRQVLCEVTSNNGVLNIFNEWKNQGEEDDSRLRFYLDILSEQIRKIEQQLSFSLKEIPLIISGMASSAIGMMELPYKKIPYAVDEELIIQNIGSTNAFKHPILLISGIRSNDDVIRGEETQLLGCIEKENGNGLFIFPGTHSKHILVKSGIAIKFKTFMTGEFFELLSKKSILAGSVEQGSGLEDPDNLMSFQSGVDESSRSSLLHSSFKVRTNNLFQSLSKQQNYFFLSGLLIGTELKELIDISETITVVSDKLQEQLYKAALNCLGIHFANFYNSTDAVLSGHEKIYSRTVA